MEYPKMLNVRLTQEQRARLQIVADHAEVSVSDIVRELIEARLAQPA